MELISLGKLKKGAIIKSAKIESINERQFNQKIKNTPSTVNTGGDGLYI